MIVVTFHPVIKCLHMFFSFYHPGMNSHPVFLTGMTSTRDEISTQQKHVNSKRHFTIDRDNFISGRDSSRDFSMSIFLINF